MRRRVDSSESFRHLSDSRAFASGKQTSGVVPDNRVVGVGVDFILNLCEPPSSMRRLKFSSVFPSWYRWIANCREDVDHSTNKTVHTFSAPWRWLSSFLLLIFLWFLKKAPCWQINKLNYRVCRTLRGRDSNEYLLWNKWVDTKFRGGLCPLLCSFRHRTHYFDPWDSNSGPSLQKPQHRELYHVKAAGFDQIRIYLVKPNKLSLNYASPVSHIGFIFHKLNIKV